MLHLDPLIRAKKKWTYQAMKRWMCVLSCFRCVPFFATLWTVARQAPLFMGFSKQEYWTGFPFPPPGDLPHPGSKPERLMSPALAGGFSFVFCLFVCLTIRAFYSFLPPPSQNGASINVHWWISGLFALSQDGELLKGGLWTQSHAVLFGLTTVSFKLEDSCFKMYWILPCNNVNHP